LLPVWNGKPRRWHLGDNGDGLDNSDTHALGHLAPGLLGREVIEMIWIGLIFVLFVALCQWIGGREQENIIRDQDAIIRKQDELIAKLESVP